MNYCIYAVLQRVATTVKPLYYGIISQSSPERKNNFPDNTTSIIHAVKEILSFLRILPSNSLVTRNIFSHLKFNLQTTQFIHFKNGLLKNTTLQSLLIDNHACH